MPPSDINRLFCAIFVYLFNNVRDLHSELHKESIICIPQILAVTRFPVFIESFQNKHNTKVKMKNKDFVFLSRFLFVLF